MEERAKLHKVRYSNVLRDSKPVVGLLRTKIIGLT